MMMMNPGDMSKMAMVGDMAMMTGSGGIPDPGNAMPGEADFNDVPSTHNQTPQTALPIGQLSGPMVWAWVTNNKITAGATDYFVFASKNGGTFQLGSGAGGVCGSANLTKIDLWTVIGGKQQNPPVEWTPGATPNCIAGSTPLVAGRTYLLGFTASATGSYSV
jgi:hypothetical protein